MSFGRSGKRARETSWGLSASNTTLSSSVRTHPTAVILVKSLRTLYRRVDRVNVPVRTVCMDEKLAAVCCYQTETAKDRYSQARPDSNTEPRLSLFPMTVQSACLFLKPVVSDSEVDALRIIVIRLGESTQDRFGRGKSLRA